MFLIIHDGHLNLAHYNFAVTSQLRLMRFMLNISYLHCYRDIFRRASRNS